MEVVRLSLLTSMCHTVLCNCTGSVVLNSRLECGGLRACGVGQLHQPVPTPMTRPVPNHTESQCTVIYGYIQPEGGSVHSILPSLSQQRTVLTVAVRLILFCSFSLCCPLKIMFPQGIFFSSSYGCDCMVCRNLELVFEITSLGHVAGVFWTERSVHRRTTQNKYTRPYSRAPRGIRTHDSIVQAAVHFLDRAFTGHEET